MSGVLRERSLFLFSLFFFLTLTSRNQHGVPVSVRAPRRFSAVTLQDSGIPDVLRFCFNAFRFDILNERSFM